MFTALCKVPMYRCRDSQIVERPESLANAYLPPVAVLRYTAETTLGPSCLQEEGLQKRQGFWQGSFRVADADPR